MFLHIYSRCDILSASRRCHASRGSRRMRARLSSWKVSSIRPGHTRGNIVFRVRVVFWRDMEHCRILDIFYRRR
ncbi:hypothetical protein NY2A_b690R [Paramecium bursaria Chlorella virus NY2A]|uniref:Uncharacterized protein b690R n=1 Tax=Paramecium bursaria Chlorella virus NY2A TaxID=46021 RepID=A7IXL5_PBCVN|nr:hypothetical protein NY2A_b690R [Paramecium bursaria Chlorella virus NY2A]ABT15089.1 hypothetical protein NY2A_b690R [Paramecium bursaria Chlorella virus NY2A]